MDDSEHDTDGSNSVNNTDNDIDGAEQLTPMPVVEQIRHVWGDHDDFEAGGFPYVAFIIEQDIADMRDDNWDEEECVEELADVCINALRMLDEQGYSPFEEISDRLQNHEEKDTEKLIEKYQRLYDEHTQNSDTER